MSLIRSVLVIAIGVSSGCAVSPPRNTENACQLFAEKPGWYDAVNDAADSWDVSEGLILSFIRQESSFVSDAKPPRVKILGIIPVPGRVQHTVIRRQKMELERLPVRLPTHTWPYVIILEMLPILLVGMWIVLTVLPVFLSLMRIVIILPITRALADLNVVHSNQSVGC